MRKISLYGLDQKVLFAVYVNAYVNVRIYLLDEVPEEDGLLSQWVMN